MVARSALALLAVAVFAGAETPVIELHAEAGVGGYARGDEATTVRVRVSSSADMDGVVRVIVGSEETHAVPYEVGVSLARGAKKAIEVPVWMPRRSACLVEFEDYYGRVLAQAPTITDLGLEPCLAIVGPSSLGIPTSGPSALQNIQTPLIPPRGLPARWVGLAPITILAMEDRQWESLEPEQREAALSWVERGGQLVLGLSDPTLPATAQAITRWAEQTLHLHTTAEPSPQVDLTPLRWTPLVELQSAVLAARREVGQGSVTLLGITRTHPSWRLLIAEGLFWQHVVQHGVAVRPLPSAPPESLLAFPTGPLAGAVAYYLLLGVAGGVVLVWRLLYVRRRLREGTWNAAAVPSRRSIVTVALGVSLPFGLLVGWPWRVEKSRNEEASILRRGGGCTRWSVDTTLRLDSRWGGTGEVGCTADEGVIAYGGPRVDEVRSPWRRGVSRDDAIFADSHARIPSLRLRGGDRLLLRGEGFVACADLDALSIQQEGASLRVQNGGRLPLRAVSVFVDGAGGSVGDLPAGNSRTLPLQGQYKRVLVRGEVVGLPPFWSTSGDLGAGTATISFERSWP